MINKIKIYISLVIAFIFLFLATGIIRAADLIVTCTATSSSSGNCTTSGSLFNELNLTPGISVARTFSVTKDGGEGCTIRMLGKNVVQTGDFMSKLLTVIKLGANDLVGSRDTNGNASTSPTTLANILNGNWFVLDSMSPNETRTYDWVVTFDKDADNDYQNNTASFDFDLNFTCGAPFQLGGAPVSGGGVGGTSLVAGVATGFLEKYLGVSTEIVEQEPGQTPTPEVQGISCTDNNYLWWLPLVFEAILVSGYYVWLKRRKVLSLRWVIIPLVLAAVSQYLHEVWGCNCATNKWCPKYIFINLIILITFFAANHLRKRSKKN